MRWTQSVYSSQVSSVGYDEEKQELYVTWIRGKAGKQRSIYAGVPEAVAVQLANAPSVGQMLNSEIKNQYAHRYG